METDTNLVLKMIDSNEKLMGKFEARQNTMDASLKLILEKVIHLEALAIEKKIDRQDMRLDSIEHRVDDEVKQLENKVNSLEKLVEKFKVYVGIVATALSAAVAGGVNFLMK